LVVELTLAGAAAAFGGATQKGDALFEQYLPVLILVGLAVGLAAALLFMSHYFGPRNPSRTKNATYECGVSPVGNARGRFPVHFYLVAMLFIAFDIEIVFLYPWAVLFRRLGFFGLMEIMLFILVLLVGYYYVWKKGVFNWE